MCLSNSQPIDVSEIGLQLLAIVLSPDLKIRVTCADFQSSDMNTVEY